LSPAPHLADELKNGRFFRKHHSQNHFRPFTALLVKGPFF
jgi:hypothetical protein